MKKLVSIIMPVYNREKFVGEAIQSILDQTYANLELIVVDDCSTDNSISVIKKFTDPRIELIQLSENKGVSAAFNYGIAEAKGDYIARLDSDDLAFPDRIEKQLNTLENNKEISICGTWLKYINKGKTLKFPANHNNILALLLERCPISIGSFMCADEVFKTFRFDETYRHGEDYEFWNRALFKFKAQNLQEVLVLYRDHGNQLSIKHKPQQIKDDARLKLNLFKKIGYNEALNKDELILMFLQNSLFFETQQYLLLYQWILEIKRNNRRLKIFPLQEFDSVVMNLINKLHNSYFFHPEKSHDIKEQLKVLTKISPIEALQILQKKVRTWLK